MLVFLRTEYFLYLSFMHLQLSNDFILYSSSLKSLWIKVFLEIKLLDLCSRIPYRIPLLAPVFEVLAILFSIDYTLNILFFTIFDWPYLIYTDFASP